MMLTKQVVPPLTVWTKKLSDLPVDDLSDSWEDHSEASDPMNCPGTLNMVASADPSGDSSSNYQLEPGDSPKNECFLS